MCCPREEKPDALTWILLMVIGAILGVLVGLQQLRGAPAPLARRERAWPEGTAAALVCRPLLLEWNSPDALWRVTLHGDGSTEARAGSLPPSWRGVWAVEDGELVVREWPGSPSGPPVVWRLRHAGGNVWREAGRHVVLRPEGGDR